MSSFRRFALAVMSIVLLVSTGAAPSVAEEGAGEAPSPPRNVIVAGIESTSVTLSWTPPQTQGSSAVTGYVIRWGAFGARFTTQTAVTVEGLTPDSDYVFSVAAANSEAESSAVAVGTKTKPKPSTPPDPPRDLQARAGAQVVELTWSAPEQGVRGYRVTWGDGEMFVTTTQAKIVSLIPNATYRIQVLSVGPGGESQPAQISVSTTLGPNIRPSAPSAPMGMTVVRDKPFSEFPYIEGPLLIQWDTPTSDGGSPITGYSVTVNGQHVTDVPATSRSTTYGDSYGGELTFEVFALNQMGTSPAARSVYDGRPTPPSAVRNLVATLGEKVRSVELTWEPPQFDGGRPVETYVVREKSRVLVETPASKRSVTLEDLAPGQTYEFRVTAVSAIGVGRSANVVIAVPDEPKPDPEAPGPIRDLNVVGTTATLITLEWKAPTAKAATRDPTGYRIMVPSKAPMSVTQTRVTIEQLAPNQPYVIQVIAVNDIGASVPVMVAVRTQIGPPSEPRALLAVPRGSPDHMALSWLPPDQTGGSPVTSYRVWWGSGEQLVNAPNAVVVGLTPGTRYTFRVTAQNIAGSSLAAEVTASTPLSPQPRPAPPSEPRNVQVSGVTARSVAVDWLEPADPGASALMYQVQVAGRSSVETSESAFLVTDLEPNQEIEVTVRAVNQMGMSAGVTVRAVTTMTTPDAPEGLRADRVSVPREVRLRWDPPRSDGGSPIRQYEVAWGDQSFLTTQPAADIAVPEAGVAYTFSVRAINDQGASLPARMRYIVPLDPQPRPGVPSEPRNVEQVATTGSSVTLRWQAPARDGGSPIQEYRVYAPGRTFIAVDQPLVTITDLAPNREYTFTVIARNQFGDSLPATTSSRTLPTRPSAPQQLLATREGPTGYVLRWQPPMDTGGIPILGYRVLWGADEAIVSSPSVTVTELAAGVRYRFRVSAINEVGESPTVDAYATTPLDPQRRPRPGPPVEVAVTGQSPSSLALSWRGAISEDDYPITEYRIEDGVGRQYTATSAAVLLTGLTPDTPYTVTIRSVSAMGESEPVTITARTATGSPEPPQPGPAPSPQPQPFTPKPPPGLDEADLDLDGNPLTVRQTAPGHWPKKRVDRSGTPLVIETFSGFRTNAGQTAKLTVTKKSPSIQSVKLTRDVKKRVWVMTATLRPNAVSGSVILTVAAPATQAKGVRYEPLQSSQLFLVRR